VPAPAKPGSGGGPQQVLAVMAFGYTLLLPSLWVCTLSFILSDKHSIYESQVEGRAYSPAHQGSYVRQVLAEVLVSEFLSPGQTVITLLCNDPLALVIDRLSDGQFPILPVVDGDRRLLGAVNLEEVHLASQAPNLKPLVLAADLMRSDIQPLTPDDTLNRALELFVENDLMALPVVDDLQSRKVIGIVRWFEIASAYLRHVHSPKATE
jgi:CIC family chloride channel protein